MKAFDLIKMALGNLLRRKSRTFLTVLGIVIGTVSIVLMIALGLGMQANINEQFESESSVNIIEVTKGDNVNTETRLSESKESDLLLDMDIDFFESIEGVATVSPVITTNIKIVSGKYEGSFNAIGLDVDTMEAMGYEVAEGRLPEEDDYTNLFFGSSAIENFQELSSGTSSGGFGGMGGGFPGGGSMPSGGNFQPPSDMGGGGPGGMDEATTDEEEETVYDVDIFSDRMTMSLNTQYSPGSGSGAVTGDVYRVYGIGILDDDDRTRSNYVYLPLETLQDMISDYESVTGDSSDEGYDKAYVLVADMDDVDSIAEYIEEYGYSTSTSSSFLETMQSTVQTITIALGAIGAVSLLVAAIGITNTMIMAIHERKKEIGVMKVIGATIKDIKRLFLLEAAVIGLLGGIFGVGISYLASIVLSSSLFSSVATGNGMRNPMSSMTTMNIMMPSWLIIAGLVFTTLVGIVSGYIPAKQAMKSSALEAIRTE